MWKTERLEGTPLSMDDAEAWLDFERRNKEHFSLGEGSLEYTLDAFTRRCGQKIAQMDAGRALVVVFRRQGIRDFSVMVSLSEIIRGPFESCFISWDCDLALEGKGYASEAVGAVITTAFSTLGLHRIEANIVPENKRSIALAKRCFFRYEGSSPSYLCIRGVWREHQHWVLLNDRQYPESEA